MARKQAENKEPVAIEEIVRHIPVIRGKKVMLDSDLAALYGTETRRLNEQVKRNKVRFPDDFSFQLTREEYDALRSQFAISKSRGGRRYMPYVFTEHGALMAATVLNTRSAIEVSVYVVRAFIRLREILVTNREIIQKLKELEQKVGEHDSALSEIIETIHRLLDSESTGKKRPIGFAPWKGE